MKESLLIHRGALRHRASLGEKTEFEPVLNSTWPRERGETFLEERVWCLKDGDDDRRWGSESRSVRSVQDERHPLPDVAQADPLYCKGKVLQTGNWEVMMDSRKDTGPTTLGRCYSHSGFPMDTNMSLVESGSVEHELLCIRHTWLWLIIITNESQHGFSQISYNGNWAKTRTFPFPRKDGRAHSPFVRELSNCRGNGKLALISLGHQRDCG